MRLQLGPHWRKPINGQGGFQTLLRRLVRLADGNGVVLVYGPLARRVLRYRKKYGRSGGFQGRLGTVLED
jgi:hypothetical protein